MTTLFLFTHSYPYGMVETFLETEIQYLPRTFDRVVIIPCRVFGMPRPVPKNVEVETSLGRHWPFGGRRALDSVSACLSSPLFYEELMTRFPRWLHYQGFARLVANIGDLARVRRWLLSYLPGSGIGLDNTIFYTYWLGPISLAVDSVRIQYPQLKLISRAHSLDLYAERHPWSYLPLRRKILNSVDRLFVVSKHGRDYLVNLYPDMNERCEVSRLGVNAPEFESSRSADRIFRIVSCSRIIPVKRLHLLIDGLRELAHLNPERLVEWHHLGDGYLRNQVESYAQQHLPENTHWYFHGHVANEKVFEFYKTCPVDVFVNVSETEGIPVSIMEAQSCGIPAIATAVGGTPEIVNSENGFLLDKNFTPSQLADSLNLLADPDLLTIKRRLSKETWEATYSAEQTYGAFADRVRSLLG